MNNESNNIFWCSIPSDLLPIHSNIIPNGAKILFAVIFNLSKEKGYCFASNKYFCETLSISDRSVNRYISALEKNGYIEIRVNNDDKRSRLIYIAQYKHNKYLRIDTDVHHRHECLAEGNNYDMSVNLSEDYVENVDLPDNMSVDSVDNYALPDNMSVEFNRNKDVYRHDFESNRHCAEYSRHNGEHNNNINIFNNNIIPSLDDVAGYINSLKANNVNIKLSAERFINYWEKRNWIAVDGYKIKDWKELYFQCNHNYKKKINGIT